MNKKIVFSVALVGLLCSAPFVLAQSVTIPNPLGNVNSFSDLLLNIISGVGALLASLGTIMVIIAGILFLTSAGSPERMTMAKKALTYAIIGIAVGVSANVIASVIIGVLKGT